MGTNNKPSMSQQSHSHQEGQQQNTAPQGTGQKVSNNNTQQLSDMLNGSEEQKRGRVDELGNKTNRIEIRGNVTSNQKSCAKNHSF